MALQTLNKTISQPFRYLSYIAAIPNSIRNKYRDFWTPKPYNHPPYEHFVQVGDPVLRLKAASVPEDKIISKELDLVIEKMLKVLHSFECVGVAAPQIGVSLKVIAMEFPERLKEKYKPPVYEARKMSTLPLTVVINPELLVTDYKVNKHPEGCMSVRGYAAEVERYDGVTLTGFDRSGSPIEMKLTGWNARIAQHEMDHLNGKLYIDKMDTLTFNCTCWEAVNNKCGRVEIPFYK